MPLKQLDHFSLRTLEVEKTRDFYVDILGLTVGDRPNFDFPGYWLYIAGQAVVHIVGIDKDDPQGLIDYLGEVDIDNIEGSGSVDHLAFVATKPEQLRVHLEEKAIPYREREVPSLNLYQIFIDDPNQVTVEINYFD
ncbi:MAG: VOC family protein [Arenicellaceae bacterium]|nr:VOC family protein [Arenicellaceae bacterium]